MRVRIELRWVLAVYTVAYASVVLALAGPDLVPLPFLHFLLWPALVCTFWVIARQASFSALGSAAVALFAAAASWLFGQAEPLLEPQSLEASLYQKPLPLVAFGLGLLLVLVALWAWRDGAWRGLFWLALVEFGVTAFAYYVVTVRGSDPGVWAHLRSPALVATGNWETAVRVTCAWLLAMATALLVRGKLQLAHARSHGE
jgi:hypothetical protein